MILEAFQKVRQQWLKCFKKQDMQLAWLENGILELMKTMQLMVHICLQSEDLSMLESTCRLPTSGSAIQQENFTTKDLIHHFVSSMMEMISFNNQWNLSIWQKILLETGKGFWWQGWHKINTRDHSSSISHFHKSTQHSLQANDLEDHRLEVSLKVNVSMKNGQLDAIYECFWLWYVVNLIFLKCLGNTISYILIFGNLCRLKIVILNVAWPFSVAKFSLFVARVLIISRSFNHKMIQRSDFNDRWWLKKRKKKKNWSLDQTDLNICRTLIFASIIYYFHSNLFKTFQESMETLSMRCHGQLERF